MHHNPRVFHVALDAHYLHSRNRVLYTTGVYELGVRTSTVVVYRLARVPDAGQQQPQKVQQVNSNAVARA